MRDVLNNVWKIKSVSFIAHSPLERSDVYQRLQSNHSHSDQEPDQAAASGLVLANQKLDTDSSTVLPTPNEHTGADVPMQGKAPKKQTLLFQISPRMNAKIRYAHCTKRKPVWWASKDTFVSNCIFGSFGSSSARRQRRGCCEHLTSFNHARYATESCHMVARTNTFQKVDSQHALKNLRAEVTCMTVMHGTAAPAAGETL